MPITFDSILSERVGFSTYQTRMFITTALVTYLNGFSEYYQLQILEILRTKLGFSQYQLEILGAVQFMGMAIGFTIFSFLSDKIGRKRIMVPSTAIFAICMLGHAFAKDFGYLIPIRILLGMTFAINEGSIYTIMCEITPLQIRGSINSWLHFLFIMGVVSNGLVCLIVWDDVDSGWWELGFMIFGGLAFVSFFMTYFILRESARFLLSRGQIEEGVAELNNMGRMNMGSLYQDLSEEDITQLRLGSIKSNEKVNLKSLFDPSIRKITIVLLTLLIFQNLIDKGVIVLIPFLSKDSEQELVDLPLYNILELFAPFLASYLIDKKSFGRKRGLIMGYIIVIISMALLYIFRNDAVFFCVALQRSSQRLTWIFLTIITLESFNTKLRTLGYGVCNLIGKLFGTISPFIFIPLYFQQAYLPFLILGILTIITAFIVFLLPQEKTQLPLDQEIQSAEEVKQEIKSFEMSNQNIII